MPSFEDALSIALDAHRGQRDKGGAPYILHPLRLALQMDTEEERITALLHDVLEDDEAMTLERLRELGYGEAVVRALDCLTRREGEDYEDFIRRIRGNRLARRVKIADLIDNMDMSRIPEPTAADHERVAKYEQALALLNEGPGTEDP